jgi:hypothetical protein
MTDFTEAMTTRAALAAAGALPPGKAVPPASLAAFEPAVLALTADVPRVAPPPGSKAKLFASLPPPEPALKIEPLTGAAFVPSGLRGITYRLLNEDRRTGRLTALVRMAPGTTLRGHAHDEHGEVEECLVLEGELTVGDAVMRAGDYQRALPGSEHIEQRSEAGALLYFSGTLDFLVL